MSDAASPLRQEDLRQWRLIEAFIDQLDRLGPSVPADSSWKDPARALKLPHYLGLFLFALVNPALATTRALCAASRLDRVQRELCGGQSVSLGSFSEAQHLCDPAWLEKLFNALAAQAPGPAPKDPHHAWQQWLARDSSLLSALPRMQWALYGAGRPKKDGSGSRGVRLHLSFNLLEDKPSLAQVTPGKTCERKSWRSQWEKGAAYVGDRYFGEDYQCLRDLAQAGCAYIVRLRDEAQVHVLEEQTLSAADRAAGVIGAARVRVGGPQHKAPLEGVRLVWVCSQNGEELRLLTNLCATQAPSELVSIMYRRRWQIEGFFKWLKCLLGCRHWLAESQRGATIQLYLALIASVLLQSAIGERPNKRMLEAIQLYQMGWARLEELMTVIQKEQRKMAAKKQKF